MNNISYYQWLCYAGSQGGQQIIRDWYISKYCLVHFVNFEGNFEGNLEWRGLEISMHYC